MTYVFKMQLYFSVANNKSCYYAAYDETTTDTLNNNLLSRCNTSFIESHILAIPKHLLEYGSLLAEFKTRTIMMIVTEKLKKSSNSSEQWSIRATSIRFKIIYQCCSQLYIALDGG